MVGYGRGGTMAYLAAARLEVAVAVIYCGGGVDQYLADRAARSCFTSAKKTCT